MKRKRQASNYVKKHYGKEYLDFHTSCILACCAKCYGDDFPVSIINYCKYVFPNFEKNMEHCSERFFNDKMRLTKLGVAFVLQFGRCFAV